MKMRRAAVSLLMLGCLAMAGSDANAADPVGFNLGYLFYGTSQTFLSDVNQARGHVTNVAPSYFELDQDGNLTLTWQFDPSFITQMHQKGLKVVPYLSNNWDQNLGRTALQNREALSTQLANTIQTYHLDGVNIDIEHLTETDRDNLTDLVRLIRAKAPARTEISVAVAANPYGWTSGWQSSYDLANLSKYADYLFLMAYDESSEGDALPGPVASYNFVEKSIQYALSHGVSNSQLVLGLPFYGRYWKQGAAYGGYGITDQQVEDLLTEYDSSVSYNAAAQSMQATITIRPSDTPIKIYDHQLGAGTYTIEYDDADTLQAKAALAAKYQLKGTGEWSLGQEPLALWNAFGQGSAPTAASSTPTVIQRKNPRGIGVLVNGNEIAFDQPPVIRNSRTLVPIRFIAESLGAEVGYDSSTQMITIVHGHVSIAFKQNSNVAQVNGSTIHLDQPSITLNNRVLVPVRFISESFGAVVNWDAPTQTVLINTVPSQWLKYYGKEKGSGATLRQTLLAVLF